MNGVLSVLPIRAYVRERIPKDNQPWPVDSHLAGQSCKALTGLQNKGDWRIAPLLSPDGDVRAGSPLTKLADFTGAGIQRNPWKWRWCVIRFALTFRATQPH
jgi:hypothetical protein